MNKLNSKKIFLSPPHMTGKEEQFISEAFDTNWIAPVGPHIEGFEKEMALYLKAPGTVALSSGTAAIHLALDILGVTKGDVVFCSTLTFVASANPILYQEAEPVFIDSDPISWNMSPQALKRAFVQAEKDKKLPKAVIIVHLYGQSARMEELMEICKSYQVPVIEDAAESLGAGYKGIPTGTIGDFGIYSFNGNKMITTAGGGMLTAKKKSHLEKAKFLAQQAKDQADYYQHSVKGYNYRMSNILAGIGRAQLLALDERVEQKRFIYKRYEEALSTKGIEFMPEYEGSYSCRWLTVCTLPMDNNPQDVINNLQSHNIEARRVWKPLHLQPLFQNHNFYAHIPGNSTAEMLFDRGICLPSGTSLSGEEHRFVIETVKASLYEKSAQGAILSNL
ncbi:aminotransferase class I/II-fold pyridoxal phosphate-dependent enzyme [Alkalicoccus halolimnae]